MAWGGRKYDAIVIGGSHNGLAAAAGLARASQRVLLLEAGPQLGGTGVTAAVGPEYPEYNVPSVAHLLEALPRRIERDLKLARHGLRLAARNIPTVMLDRDGRHLVLPRNRKDLAALAEVNRKDAAAWPDFDSRIGRAAAMLAPLLFDAAPRRTLLRRLVWRAEWHGPDALGRLMQLLPQSVGDLLDAEFELPLLKGALALDAVLGTSDGPYAPGTAFRLLHRRAMRGLGRGPSIPLGGPGALTDALAAAVAAQRGEIRTGTRVVRLLLEGNAVAGVETDDGNAIIAPLVVSALDPRTTMFDLLGTAHLETGFVRRLPPARPQGNVGKLNLALDGLPEFPGLAAALHGARLLLAPSLEAVEHAAVEAARGGIAGDPVMEITMPGTVDPALCPAGHHVMSVLLPFTPYAVEGGWASRRDELMQRALRMLDQYAPGLSGRLIAAELLTPPDIETQFGASGGNWYRGSLAPAAIHEARAAGQAAPVAGLWLCGPGTHPGDGVTGLPGYALAETIAAERRRQ